jgi:hypothetical protein
MTALSANKTYVVAGRAKFTAQIIDGDIVYAGAYVGLGSRSHATAATRGRMLPYTDDVGGLIPLGFAEQKATGETTTLLTETPVDVSGKVVKGVTITDDAATIADAGRWVYVTDDGTFTLTRPTTIGTIVGITTRFLAADTFDVYFFSFGELCAIAAGGQGKVSWHIGCIVPELAATGDSLKGIVCPYHGYITNYYAICASAPADADLASTFRLEVDGTDLDFATSQPPLGFADAVAAKVVGVGALTPTKVHEGSLIDVEEIVTTAGTVGDGLYNVYVEIELQPGV